MHLFRALVKGGAARCHLPEVSSLYLARCAAEARQDRHHSLSVVRDLGREQSYLDQLTVLPERGTEVELMP
ncbi:hypothetical protein E2C01_001666 [Portunus trituberculatus]|uniref:Uncharacterized protein n=1 Tax=Portunus trituberculatus TaxID=210409 RepID=A0A5B7CID0_PORTR|nr:hypothetical protein [Portunus trituberculatus]